MFQWQDIFNGIGWKQAVLESEDTMVDMNHASQDLDRFYVHVEFLKLNPVFRAA
jgi:hypothetical protein